MHPFSATSSMAPPPATNPDTSTHEPERLALIISTPYVIVITHKWTSLSCSHCKNSTNPTNSPNWLCSDCVVDSFPFSHLDEACFNLVSFENAYSFVDFDGDRYQSLCFNPLDSIHRAGNLNDLDPDTNFCRSSSTCGYFLKTNWMNQSPVNFLTLFLFRTAIPHPFLF